MTNFILTASTMEDHDFVKQTSNHTLQGKETKERSALYARKKDVGQIDIQRRNETNHSTVSKDACKNTRNLLVING